MARPEIKGTLVERLRQVAVADIFYDPSFEDEEDEQQAWEEQIAIAIATIEEAAAKLVQANELAGYLNATQRRLDKANAKIIALTWARA